MGVDMISWLVFQLLAVIFAIMFIFQKRGEKKTKNPMTVEQLNYVRLMMIIDQVARDTMQKVFSMGAPRKNPLITLKYYLTMEKGISNADYKKAFNRTHRSKIDSDPACQTFDVSIWFSAIQWGCDGLAAPGDKAWYDSPDTLENHLKRIKDFRNDVMHNTFSISTIDCLEEIEYIRSLIVNTLKLAGTKYSLPADQVNRLTSDQNKLINQIRNCPLTQMDLNTYENTALFKGLQGILLNTGRKDLKKLFRRMSRVNPASMIIGYNIHLKVDMIFTTLHIVKSGRNEDHQTICHTDILHYAQLEKQKEGSNMSQVILIEGIAGIGKTTLVKMLLSDWTFGKGTVKELGRYDFIITMECRNRTISSLSELVSSLMPTAKNSFQEDKHAVDCLLDLNTLIIVDGLDELNSVSKQLFMEIMTLKRIENITIICTTRPEKVEEYYRMVPDDVTTVHMRINGIPENLQEEFISKYHEALKANGVSNQETEGLIKYYRMSTGRLKDYWKLPLNLTLLSLLWAINSQQVNSITTVTELLLEIQEMMIKKLLERLDKCDSTRSVSSSILKGHVQVFVDALYKMALTELQDNAIILKGNSVSVLGALCTSLSLPAEEALGAFLIQSNAWSPKGFVTQHSFPHKSLQDHYASQYIYSEVVGNNTNMAAHGKTIMSVLKDIHGTDTESFPLAKFQNVFVMLIGLFYHYRTNLKESLLDEVIDLLQKSGVERREEWIRILNQVRCDDKIARLIVTHVPSILEGTVEIEDAEVFAYATLFKSNRPEKVAFRIMGNPEEIPRLDELFGYIAHHRCTVEYLFLEYLYNNPQQPLASFPMQDGFPQLMKMCKVLRYTGPVDPTLHLYRGMLELCAAVANSDCFRALHNFLSLRTTRPDYLEISLSSTVEAASLSPLPLMRDTDGQEVIPFLFLPDVHDIMPKAEVAKRLQPVNGFRSMYLPRCTFTTDRVTEMISALRGLKIKDNIYFPLHLKPSSPEEKESLEHQGMETLNCRIRWANESDIWW